MAFKLKSVKKVQIYYLESCLCSMDLELECIYTVESVFSDMSGNQKAKLFMKVDDTAKMFCGDYQIEVDQSVNESWVEQAEKQIMDLSEFTGALAL